MWELQACSKNGYPCMVRHQGRKYGPRMMVVRVWYIINAESMFQEWLSMCGTSSKQEADSKNGCPCLVRHQKMSRPVREDLGFSFTVLE